jgi:methenyltetrahydrofolate cyclohydrolase
MKKKGEFCVEKFINNSLEYLIEKISSKEPVPGGGAVSALSASFAVSLCEMVIGLTIGKKIFLGYDEKIQEKMVQVKQECENLKLVFLDLFDKDNLSFEKVMEAMKLPKETEEEKEYRRERIEQSYIGAMEVPLEVSKRVLGFYENIEFVAQYGNKNCITDVGVSSLQALSAVEGAVLNVKINLIGIGNENLSKDIQLECQKIQKSSREFHKKIMVLVEDQC